MLDKKRENKVKQEDKKDKIFENCNVIEMKGKNIVKKNKRNDGKYNKEFFWKIQTRYRIVKIIERIIFQIYSYIMNNDFI